MLSKTISISISIIMAAFFKTSNAQFGSEKLSLIPAPLNIQIGKGEFLINSSTTLNLMNDEFKSEVEIFNNYIVTNYGFRLNTVNSSEKKEMQINIFKCIILCFKHIKNILSCA